MDWSRSSDIGGKRSLRICVEVELTGLPVEGAGKRVDSRMFSRFWSVHLVNCDAIYCDEEVYEERVLLSRMQSSGLAIYVCEPFSISRWSC